MEMYIGVNLINTLVHNSCMTFASLIGCGMTRTNGNETGWRGSADVWLSAAYDGLIESGMRLPLVALGAYCSADGWRQ